MTGNKNTGNSFMATILKISLDKSSPILLSWVMALTRVAFYRHRIAKNHRSLNTRVKITLLHWLRNKSQLGRDWY